MMEEAAGPLAAFLADKAGARAATISGLAKLSGGAIQENWALDARFDGGAWAGNQALVLRTDAPSAVQVSLGRADEFALFQAAFAAGVTVPEPLWADTQGAVLGKPFFVMRRARGVAAGHKLVKDDALSGDREALAEALGRELARIHAIDPVGPDLAFLGPAPADPARARIAEFRAWLDHHPAAHPILEWALRWLDRHAPAPDAPVLCHNDFRVGNVMVDAGRVSAVLDWEFAGWGDRNADIGWFCAPCWRFGRRDREAGGIGPREAFYRGYEAESGRPVARAAIFYWEVMATLRWAVIALQQADRHVREGEENLELALTAHIVPDLELDLMAMSEGVPPHAR